MNNIEQLSEHKIAAMVDIHMAAVRSLLPGATPSQMQSLRVLATNLAQGVNGFARQSVLAFLHNAEEPMFDDLEDHEALEFLYKINSAEVGLE